MSRGVNNGMKVVVAKKYMLLFQIANMLLEKTEKLCSELQFGRVFCGLLTSMQHISLYLLSRP